MRVKATAIDDGLSTARRAFRTIAIEEACLPAQFLDEWEGIVGHPFPPGWGEALGDLQGLRLREMDRDGIEMSVLSLTIPGPQGLTDRAASLDLARRTNDAIAEIVARHPKRLAALAAVPMLDTDDACRELERAVRDLGMRGVLVNDAQRTGDPTTPRLFYDLPRFDPFWSTLEQLDLPFYLHPTSPTSDQLKDFEGHQCLTNAAWAFAIYNGTHALRLICGGVFDRHPKAQMILGHNGDHVVYDLWRINDRIEQFPMDYRAEHLPRHYFRTNIHISTSGQFNDIGLAHLIGEVGVDRIIFAVDAPYERSAQATEWFANAPLSEADAFAIGRGNAIRLMKLPLDGAA